MSAQESGRFLEFVPAPGSLGVQVELVVWVGLCDAAQALADIDSIAEQVGAFLWIIGHQVDALDAKMLYVRPHKAVNQGLKCIHKHFHISVLGIHQQFQLDPLRR